MKEDGANFENLWRKIKTLVGKTLLSGIDRIKQYSQKIHLSDSEDIMQENKCFELLGIDVLVDDTLHPWLLEVNPDPDLSAKSNFPLAKVVKSNLLHDLLHLVGILPVDKFALSSALASKIQIVSHLKQTLVRASPVPMENNPLIDFYIMQNPEEEVVNDQCMLLKLLERCRFKVKEDFFRYIPQFVESELEMHRLKHITRIGKDKKNKSWERVLPSPNPAYLDWYESSTEMDKFMSCFAREYKDRGCIRQSV